MYRFFGDGFVSGNFGFGKASVDIVFSYDAVGDLVHGKKVSIRGAGIAFVGIDDIDFLIGVHAVDGGIGQIGRVTVGGRGEGGRQNQSIFHIDCGMFFQGEMGALFLMVQSDSKSRENFLVYRFYPGCRQVRRFCHAVR